MPKQIILELSSVHPYPDTRIHSKYSNFFKKTYRLYQTGENENKKKSLTTAIYFKKQNSRFLRFIFGNIKAIKLIYRIKPHYVHVHDPELLPSMIFAKFSHTYVIYDSHESLPLQILQKNWIKIIPKKMLILIAKSILRLQETCSDIIVGATHEITNSYTHKRKITVQNYPTMNDYKIFKHAIEMSEMNNILNICYVGAYLDNNRGLEEIISLIDFLNQSDFIFKFYIVGDISNENMKKKLSGTQNVILTGKIDRLSAIKIMTQCNIGVILEHKLPNHLDALPIKIFEYAFAGLDIICTDIPLWENIVVNELKIGKAVNINKTDEIGRWIIDNYHNGNYEKDKLSQLNISQQLFCFEKSANKLLKLMQTL